MDKIEKWLNDRLMWLHVFFVILVVGMYWWAFASTNNYNDSIGDHNGWNVNNYTPVVTDWNTSNLVFDNTSDNAVTFGASDTVLSITSTSDYGGNMSFDGYTLYTLGSRLFDGTGTLDLGAGVYTKANSATSHIGSGVGTVTATSCVVTWDGTDGVLDFDKLFETKQYVFGNSATVNITSSQEHRPRNNGIPLIFGNNVTITGGGMFRAYRTTSGELHSTGSGCVLGCGLRFNTASAGINCEIPAITTSGVVSINTAEVNCTTKLTGNLSSGNAMEIYDASIAGFVVNFNGYDITSSATFYPAMITVSSVLNFGSGTHTFKVFDGTLSSVGTCNFESATINVNGDYKLATNQTVNPGTSTVNITNTSTIISANKKFHNLNINASGKTVTGADRIWADSVAVLAGTLALGGTGTDTLTKCRVLGTINTSGDTVHALSYDIDAGATLTKDTASLWQVADGGIVRMGGKEFPYLNNLGTTTFWGNGSFAGFGMATTGGDSARFEPAKKYTFLAKPIIRGSGLTRNAWVSHTATQRDTIDFPAKDTLKNFYIRDQIFLDTCYCKRADTCLSGGGGY
jgi:hypothetical protein